MTDALKENATEVVSVSWSKVLSKPFILKQVLSKLVKKSESYSGLIIFKMAVMDAPIFWALWHHTAQIKYTKT